MPIYSDVRELTVEKLKTDGIPKIDIISGGFPCQDISIAGKGKGINGERSGLWHEMFRIIREIRPKYIIIENSPMLLVRGFEQVLCNLYEIRYNAEWRCICNSDFGFPHKRERLYCICYDSDKIRRSKISFFPGNIGETEGAFNWEFSRIFSPEFLIENYPEFLRMDNGIPYNVHRLESVGNAVNPYIASYLFYLIKKFDNETNED